MNWRIARALVLIEQRLDRPLRVADLAADLNLSSSRLCHLFRAECGCSPVAYLRALRIRRAHVLLTETPLLVKQAMAAVGINDASHFVRDFRHQFGESPTALRSRLGGTNQIQSSSARRDPDERAPVAPAQGASL